MRRRKKSERIRCWCEREHKFSSRHIMCGGEEKFYIEKLPQWLLVITLFHKSLFLHLSSSVLFSWKIHLPHDVHFVFINISTHFPSLFRMSTHLVTVCVCAGEWGFFSFHHGCYLSLIYSFMASRAH